MAKWATGGPQGGKFAAMAFFDLMDSDARR